MTAFQKISISAVAISVAVICAHAITAYDIAVQSLVDDGWKKFDKELQGDQATVFRGTLHSGEEQVCKVFKDPLDFW